MPKSNKSLFSKILGSLRHRAKLLLRSEYRDYHREMERLSKYPRFKKTNTGLLKKPLQIVDAASFLFMYKEIFQHQIYSFHTENQSPCIIDCGANIGLSIIYFKQLFPEAKIIGFEPDKQIFSVLEHNMHVFEIEKVKLINKGLWDEQTTLKFYQEGADGGRVTSDGDMSNLVEIHTEKLSDYLNEHVDFLKIDIEGAELRVLEECKDKLHNVDRIFIEYHSFVDHCQYLDKLLKILRTNHFRYHINSPGLSSKQPFMHIRKIVGMDMQLNIYAFRDT